MNLQGKACLITGGTKGIGQATAIEFARLGADIAITGRHHDEEAKKTVAAVKAARAQMRIDPRRYRPARRRENRRRADGQGLGSH